MNVSQSVWRLARVRSLACFARLSDSATVPTRKPGSPLAASGDKGSGADEIHTRPRNFEDTRREVFLTQVSPRGRRFSRARACISPDSAKIRDYLQYLQSTVGSPPNLRNSTKILTIWRQNSRKICKSSGILRVFTSRFRWSSENSNTVERHSEIIIILRKRTLQLGHDLLSFVGAQSSTP